MNYKENVGHVAYFNYLVEDVKFKLKSLKRPSIFWTGLAPTFREGIVICSAIVSGAGVPQEYVGFATYRHFWRVKRVFF